jgi:ribosomal protein S18 acetylase RimI-like enzyme
MPEVKLIPLSLTDPHDLKELMDLEERAWHEEIDWDYGPIRKILSSFIEQRLLPGFVAIVEGKPAAYLYFLIGRLKGMIGTLFAAGPQAQRATEIILTRAIESLKDTRSVCRIEAQIIPVGGLQLTDIFLQHGFDHFLRHYLELNLNANPAPAAELEPSIVPWDPKYVWDCAEVGYRSYRNGIDAVICADYTSISNCESYIHSLAENPGCGVFLPNASFVALDRRGAPCGFILASKLSSTSGMIPQISIHPAHQGQRLGSALIQRTLERLKEAGLNQVRLTVSHQNRRAHEWYRRLGFHNRRDFGAYVWQRE